MFYSCVQLSDTVVANRLASKSSELIGNTAIVRKRSKAPRNPQNVELFVLASCSCRDYAKAQERKCRPVAGLRISFYNACVVGEDLVAIFQTFTRRP